jgi:hypothetical protein
MNELSEQEQLARLVSGDEVNREPLDSANMLTQGLLDRMGGVSNRILNEVNQEIEASGDTADHTPVSRFAAPSDGSNGAKPDAKLLVTLKNIRHGLIDVFERSGLNSGVEDHLVNLIEKTSACIQYLGEPIEKFKPLSHLSGLQAPDMVKNANKVVDTTIQCYKLGEIDDTTVSDDGRNIGIVFSGEERGMKYKAYGTITARSWEGSEAIDYIYVPETGGKMSVKTFENGKWADKSDNGQYDIYYELEETDTTVEGNSQDDENNTSSENDITIQSDVEVEKNVPEKKEVLPDASKYEDDDEEI